MIKIRNFHRFCFFNQIAPTPPILIYESIPCQHFKMQGLNCLPNILKKEDYLRKLNLKDAYFFVPLNHASRRFFYFFGQRKVSLSMFWTWSCTKNFYEITQNSIFSVTTTEHNNCNLLGWHVADRPRVMARNTVIFLLQQLELKLNLNK